MFVRVTFLCKRQHEQVGRLLRPRYLLVATTDLMLKCRNSTSTREQASENFKVVSLQTELFVFSEL